MISLNKKKNQTRSSSVIKRSCTTAWDIMRRTANDNTPPTLYWFYKILILSLFIFGIIQLISFV
jgi:hypothetical protein